MSTTYFNLGAANFFQDWTNIGLLTTANDWSNLPSIVGFRGDDLTTATGTDPTTLTGDPAGDTTNLLPNQTNPTTFATGGVAEFHLADPTIALNGSGTADAPY